MKNIIILTTTVLLLHVAANAGAQSTQAYPSSGAPSSTAAIFSSYFEIQKALAGDTLADVPAYASALANSVREDKTGAFRPELAAVADSLAMAQDMESARQIFKAVSGYLIQTYRAGNGPGGTIHEAHSPVANVNWLQQDDNVQNPYVGKSDLRCGEFVN